MTEHTEALNGENNCGGNICSDSKHNQSHVSPDTEIMFKKIRIQLGVVSRLIKEHSYYIKDSGSLLRQVEEMKV
jgi:hypothetical protein